MDAPISAGLARPQSEIGTSVPVEIARRHAEDQTLHHDPLITFRRQAGRGSVEDVERNPGHGRHNEIAVSIAVEVTCLGLAAPLLAGRRRSEDPFRLLRPHLPTNKSCGRSAPDLNGAGFVLKDPLNGHISAGDADRQVLVPIAVEVTVQRTCGPGSGPGSSLPASSPPRRSEREARCGHDRGREQDGGDDGEPPAHLPPFPRTAEPPANRVPPEYPAGAIVRLGRSQGQ